MRAVEFLTALSIKVYSEEYEGLFIKQNKKYVPVTNILREEDRIIFMADNSLPAITMSELHSVLTANKKARLFYDNGKDIFPMFGFREEKNKIII